MQMSKEMLDAYIKCALWSSYDTLTDDDGDEYQESLDYYELAEGVRDELAKDLLAFVTDPAVSRDLEGLSDSQIGHDFWLTRNGHGAGFWDRGLGQRGDRLTKATKPYGEVNLYVGDDGLVYVS